MGVWCWADSRNSSFSGRTVNSGHGPLLGTRPGRLSLQSQLCHLLPTGPRASLLFSCVRVLLNTGGCWEAVTHHIPAWALHKHGADNCW